MIELAFLEISYKDLSNLLNLPENVQLVDVSDHGGKARFKFAVPKGCTSRWLQDQAGIVELTGEVVDSKLILNGFTGPLA